MVLVIEDSGIGASSAFSTTGVGFSCIDEDVEEFEDFFDFFFLSLRSDFLPFESSDEYSRCFFELFGLFGAFSGSFSGWSMLPETGASSFLSEVFSGRGRDFLKTPPKCALKLFTPGDFPDEAPSSERNMRIR